MLRITEYIIEFFARATHVLIGQGNSCIYDPTCSRYGKEAIAKHGFFLGTFKTILRVLRCHPFAKGGPDPVR